MRESSVAGNSWKRHAVVDAAGDDAPRNLLSIVANNSCESAGGVLGSDNEGHFEKLGEGRRIG